MQMKDKSKIPNQGVRSMGDGVSFVISYRGEGGHHEWEHPALRVALAVVVFEDALVWAGREALMCRV